MQVPIKHKRSAVAGSVPALADIAAGEFAINTHDGKVYFKKTDSGGETLVSILRDTDVGSVVQEHMPEATQTEAEAGTLSTIRSFSPLRLSQAIASLAPDSTPAGAVIYVARNTAPAGWLHANGTTLSRTTYSDLFAAIGTTFGAGDGSTTFNIPDLRGEFIRGWAAARGVDTGRGLGTFQDQRTGSKGLEDFMEIRKPYAYGNLNMNVFAPKGGVHPNYGGSTGGYRATLTASAIGETRPRNIALMACIKY